MTVIEGLEFFARFVWPLLLAWNIYLYRVTINNREAMYKFRLHVAENYTGKNDLEKMFADFERRMDKRLEQICGFNTK